MITRQLIYMFIINSRYSRNVGVHHIIIRPEWRLEKTTSPLAVSLGSLLIMYIDVYYNEINLLLQFVVMYLVGNYYFFNQNLKNGDSQFIVLFCLLSYNSAV